MQPIRQQAATPLRIARFAGIAAATVALSGCGGSDPDAVGVLKRTFMEPHSYASGQLDAKVLLDGPGLTGRSGKLELQLKGPFRSNGKGTVPSFMMDTGLALGNRSVKLLVTSDGKQMWLGIAGLQYRMPSQIFSSFASGWLGGGKGASGSLLGRLGFRPADWLRNPRTVGEEDVGGVETVHVKSEVDGAALVAQLGTLLGSSGNLLGVNALDPARAQQLAQSVRQAGIDVWSAKSDGSLRRLDVVVDVAPRDGSGETRLYFSFTLYRLNEPQVIAIPQSSRPFNELANMIKSVGSSLGANGDGAADSGK